ncbi:MAG TPA: pyruvate kinase [Saprospiraceae bacterium]|nr:pyruvate kinase [Saprospiraceae bacterium]HRP42956.1 pyruvate kinase [Saprospiraceae bacterium]
MAPLIPVNNKQKTKIIATIGPASSGKEALLDLVRAGVNVFRLNFSHGAHAQHQEVIDRILEINEKYNLHIGILADLQGPKLRVGKIENNALDIEPGDILTFVNQECIGNRDKIYMSYDHFAQDVKPGEKVLVDDGKIVLQVVSTNQKDEVKLKVLFGSVLSSNKGVNLPETVVSQPSLTPKDIEDLEYILTQPVNWIALSFVRQAKDIRDLQKKIAEKNHFAKVIAKIEKPEAINNIKEIIKVSDAIMIARGDLGVEFPIEKLPGIQKMIISRCIQKSKPVIVATQMMESMITNPSPTRAEVTDVANAVLDGTDAVMLSGETSVGNHPSLVVDAMRKIITEAEKHYHMQGKRVQPVPESETFLSDVLCLGAPRIAEEVHAKAILGLTVNGYTAFRMSSYRPKPKIYIFSDKPHMLNTLSLVWGIKCYLYTKFTTTDETFEDLNQILKDEGVVKQGDIVINTGSMPLYKKFRTNMLKITIIE